MNSSVLQNENIESLSLHRSTLVAEAFETLFDSDSTICFVCLECKAMGNFHDIEEQSSLHKKNASASTVMLKREHSAAIEVLKQQHTAAIGTITQQLTLSNAKIDELSASTSSSVQINCDDLIGKKASIDSLLSDMIVSSNNQTTHLQRLASALNAILSPVSENDGHNSDQRGSEIESLPESHESIGASNVSHGTGKKLPKTKFSLRPPVREANADVVNSSCDNALDIYVSKFEPDTSCDDISSHICANTNLIQNFTDK